MKSLLLIFSAVLLWPSLVAQAKHVSGPEAGDGDPFPLRCVDFSGAWRSDRGVVYNISQSDCKFLKINMAWGNYEEDTISIVPDNKSRMIPGRERSAVRHRWNNPREGKVLETHRTFIKDGYRITEVVMYEIEESAGLLLESVFVTYECLARPGQAPERDYEQQVFRRVSRGGGSPEGVAPGRGRPRR